MPPPSRPLDTHIEIVTPENIAFHYRVAGPFQRLPAYLLDVLIQGAVLVLLFIVLLLAGALARLPGGGLGAWAVFYFFVSWFYFGFFETVLNGQTPGKWMTKLRVVSIDGQPINAQQAILRNLLRGVDALFVYQPAFISMMMTERFQRLGDLACGTAVVVEEPQYRYGVVRIAEPEVLALTSEIPPGFVLSRSLAQALSSYVLRRSSMPWSRRLQIARYVGEPLREQFGLPVGTNYDWLLCAVYHKAFFGGADAAAAREQVAASGGVSPFMAAVVEPDLVADAETVDPSPLTPETQAT